MDGKKIAASKQITCASGIVKRVLFLLAFLSGFHGSIVGQSFYNLYIECFPTALTPGWTGCKSTTTIYYTRKLEYCEGPVISYISGKVFQNQGTNVIVDIWVGKDVYCDDDNYAYGGIIAQVDFSSLSSCNIYESFSEIYPVCNYEGQGRVRYGISPPAPTKININVNDNYVVEGEPITLTTDVYANCTKEIDYQYDSQPWTRVTGTLKVPSTSSNKINFRSRAVLQPLSVISYSPYCYKPDVDIRKFPNVLVTPKAGKCYDSKGSANIQISGLTLGDGVFIFVDGQNVKPNSPPFTNGNFDIPLDPKDEAYKIVLYYCKGPNYSLYISKSYTDFIVPHGADKPPSNLVITSSNPTACEGIDVSFSVTASGTSSGINPFAYEWKKFNEAAVLGKSSTLTLNRVTTAKAGTYIVNVHNTCGAASASATLTVNPLPTNTYTLSDPAICNGQQATIIQNGSQTGVNYQLQLSPSSANVGNPIAGSNGSGISYTISPTTSTTYKVVATTSTTPNCSLTLTDLATVTVNTPPTANAGGPNAVCQSATPAAIPLSGASVGSDAKTQGAWSIVPINSTIYGTLSSTAYSSTPATVIYTPAANFSGTVTLRLTTNFPASCSAAVSERTITVSPTSVGGAVKENQTICTGSVPVDLSLKDNTGDVVKWQKSSDIGFSSPTDIVGSSTTLSGSSIGSLTSQTYLRAVVKSGACSEVYSQPAAISISPTSIGGTVSGNQTICYGDKPADLILTGSRGIIKWQSSPDNVFSSTTDIGESSTILNGDDDIGILYDTTYFRAVVQSGACPPAISNWVVVNVNPIVEATVAISTEKTKICEGSSVTFNATPNYGWLNPTYEWMVNGSPFGTNSPSFTSSTLTSNNEVRVMMIPNGVSCLQEQSVVSNGITMTVNPLPAAIVGTSRSICFGSSATLGAAAVSGSTYSWTSNPVGFTSTQSNPTVSPTANTTYTMVETITATGCSKSNSVTITVNPKPALGAPTLTHNECFSGNAGQIIISASGGTPTYSYTLTGGGNMPITTADGVFKNLPAASNYSVTVTDNNGCNDIRGGITLTQPVEEFRLFIAKSQSITCPGGSDGWVELEVAGGAPGYQFSKDGSTWVSLVSPYRFDNLIFSGKPFSVRDSKGCVVSASNPVIQPEPISLTPVISDVICKGDSTGNLSIALTGGTPSYTLLLTEPNGYSHSVSSVASAAEFSSLKAGIYTLTASDLKGCPKSETFEVKQPFEPLTLALKSSNNPSCHSYSNGSIDIDASGGWKKYTYMRLPDGLSNNNGIFRRLGAKTYNFKVDDSLGCTSNISVIIGEPDSLIISTPVITNLSCKGDGTGAIEFNGVGGTPSYSYMLMGGGIITPWITTDGKYTNLPAANNYSILIVDKKGCTASGQVEVTEPDSLKILISNRGSNGHTISCPGKMDTVWVKPVGGTFPFTLTPKVGSSVNYYPKGFALYDQPNGQYMFTITDDHGCSKADTAVISNLPGPRIKLISVGDATCSYSKDGRIEIEPSSVTGTVNVSWLGYSNTSSVFDGLLGGSYTARVTDLYGCTHDTTIAVGKPNPIAVNLLKKADPICFGNADGMLRVSASGGNMAPYAYLWSNGSQVDSTGLIPSGIYTVVVSDIKGCKDTATYTIIDPPSLRPSLPSLVTICSNQTYEADAGMPNATYLWFSPNGFTSSSRTPTLSSPGVYYLMVTNSKGCSGKDTLTLEKSSGIIDANFIMAEKASVGDTIVLIEMSWPVPQSIEWSYPASFNPIYHTDYSIYLVPQVVGSYSIGLTSFVAACTEYIEKVIIVEPSKGKGKGSVSKQPIIRDVVAYPNPNRGDFSVDVELNVEAGVMVEVYSVYGQKLLSKQGKGLTKYKVDINLFQAPGIYLVRISAGSESRSLRVVVK